MSRTLPALQTRLFSSSSNMWLQRQRNDHFVKQAKKEGFASRASFKILQILEGQPIFKHTNDRVRIVDLGAAPGSWSQALSKHFSQLGTPYDIIAVDKQNLSVAPPNGVHFIQGDFTEKETREEVSSKLGGKLVDLVITDMAPAACGDKQLDHARLVNLSEEALFFAVDQLKRGGTFVSKLSHGTYEQEFKQQMLKHFLTVKLLKPPASRKNSNECFFLATQKK